MLLVPLRVSLTSCSCLMIATKHSRVILFAITTEACSACHQPVLREPTRAILPADTPIPWRDPTTSAPFVVAGCDTASACFLAWEPYGHCRSQLRFDGVY
jgi:hypothetical protein